MCLFCSIKSAHIWGNHDYRTKRIWLSEMVSTVFFNFQFSWSKTGKCCATGRVSYELRSGRFKTVLLCEESNGKREREGERFTYIGAGKWERSSLAFGLLINSLMHNWMELTFSKCTTQARSHTPTLSHSFLSLSRPTEFMSFLFSTCFIILLKKTKWMFASFLFLCNSIFFYINNLFLSFTHTHAVVFLEWLRLLFLGHLTRAFKL